MKPLKEKIYTTELFKDLECSRSKISLCGKEMSNYNKLELYNLFYYNQLFNLFQDFRNLINHKLIEDSNIKNLNPTNIITKLP